MIYAIFIWHGVFLSITLAMIDFNTVFPALITDLGGSKIVFGILYSIMLGAPYILSFLFGHFLSRHRYRRKFLILGIYLRAFAFLGMAAVTYFLGAAHPQLVLASFFAWILLFSLSGGLAGISYNDIIGKLLPKGKRGALFAAKQFASSLAAFGGGLIVARVFSAQTMTFPVTHAATLFIGFSGLIIASLAFWFLREPASPVIVEEDRPSFFSMLRQVPEILRRNREFSRFIVVENLSSFGLMIMPFYMIFAREHFVISDLYIGRYLLFQIAGTVLSNLLWGVVAGRLGAKRVVWICLILGATIPFVALGLSYASPNLFAITFFLMGFVMSGRRVGFEPYLLDIIPSAERAVFLGIRGTMNFLVVLLPFLGGILIQLVGYIPVFILVSGMLLIASYLLKRGGVSRRAEDSH